MKRFLRGCSACPASWCAASCFGAMTPRTCCSTSSRTPNYSTIPRWCASLTCRWACGGAPDDPQVARWHRSRIAKRVNEGAKRGCDMIGDAVTKGDEAEPLLDLTVGDLLMRAVEERGGDIALIVPHQNIRWTYSDLAG